jgi:hypothetical protein
VLAGPFHPPMQATPVDGGYRVTGRSPFASNCRDVTWIAVTAMVMDGNNPRLHENGAPEVLAVFFPSEACEILDTWYVLGMRGTGSDDIAIRDVFVPRTRTCPLVPEFTPGEHYQGPLCRLPAMGAITATFPSIVLAIARHAIDAVSALAQEKTPFGSTTVLRGRASAQERLAQAEGALRSARALVYQTLGEAWERAVAGEWPSLAQRADLLLATDGDEQCSQGGGAHVQRRGHERHLHEEPAGALLPRHTGAEATWVRLRESVRNGRPSVSRSPAGVRAGGTLDRWTKAQRRQGRTMHWSRRPTAYAPLQLPGAAHRGR